MTTVLGLVLLCVLTPLRAEVVDRLEQPAIASRLAPSSLLLDLDRAGGRLLALGERGHILYSDDQGRSWTQAAVPLSVTLTALDMVDERRGWAVGHDGAVLRTDDGGATWARQLDGRALNHLLVTHYETRLKALRSGEVGEEGVDIGALEFALEDARFLAEQGPGRSLLDLHFIDRQQGWVVGAYGLALETRDAGRSWKPLGLQLNNPDGFHLNRIFPWQAGLMVAGEAGLLRYRASPEASWQVLEPPYSGSFFAALPLAHEGAVLLSGLRGRLFMASPQAMASATGWQVLETPTQATLNGGLKLADGGLVLLGNEGVLLYRPGPDKPFKAYPQPARRSYLAALETEDAHLVLVGEGGAQRLPLSALETTAND